jgi:hypothetical protein
MKMGGVPDKQSTTVTIDLVDYVYLNWADDINRSGLFRKAIRRRMRDDGITPGHLQDRLVNALDAGVTQDTLLETSNEYELDRLLADELDQ